jgi:hypothetical protein
MTGMTFETFLRVRTRYQAERDASGVYKMLLKLTSPEALALRLPRLVAQYLDFARAETHVVAPGHVVFAQTTTPRALARWFQLVHEGYIDTLVPMSGAKNVRYRADARLTTDHVRDGIELVTLRGDVCWDVKA